MPKKFAEGDRVVRRAGGAAGTVTDVGLGKDGNSNANGRSIRVKFDGEDEPVVIGASAVVATGIDGIIEKVVSRVRRINVGDEVFDRDKLVNSEPNPGPEFFGTVVDVGLNKKGQKSALGRSVRVDFGELSAGGENEVLRVMYVGKLGLKAKFNDERNRLGKGSTPPKRRDPLPNIKLEDVIGRKLDWLSGSTWNPIELYRTSGDVFVVNLTNTTGCTHYKRLLDYVDLGRFYCSVVGCQKKFSLRNSSACHVRFYDASARTVNDAANYLVNMCQEHNHTPGPLQLKPGTLVRELHDCGCQTNWGVALSP